MSHLICLVFTESQSDNLKSIITNYPKHKVNVIEERYSPSGLGLEDDALIQQFDTISETLLRNVYMIIADRSILAFTMLIDSSVMIFNHCGIDNKERIQVGNNMFIKVL